MTFSPSTLRLLQFLAPLSALTTSTMIAGFSYLQTPVLVLTTSQTSPSLALRQLRPYFEQGKYIFPPMAIVSTALFLALAYAQPDKLVGYSVAAAGAFGILPFTSLYMIPKTNNQILHLDDTTLQGDGNKVDDQRAKVVQLLQDFKRENYVRACMYWIGGAVGLYTVLL